MGITRFRASAEVDRLLALALQEYEDGLCAGCGQPLRESMDPDLADEWTTMPAVRCHGCTAISQAAEADKDRPHPAALRYIPGVREGWEERKALTVAARAERAAADQQG